MVIIDQHLHQLISGNTRIMQTQAQLAQSLQALAAQGRKANQEMADKVAALMKAVEDAGSSTPEVDAALADLQGVIQAADDMNPDTPAGGGEQSPADGEAPAEGEAR